MTEFTYTTKPSTAEHALTLWSFSANQACSTRVVPDGCCDFIIRESLSGALDWFISDLSTSSYRVPTKQGERMFGLRLQPGTQIDVSDLSGWLEGREPFDLLNEDQIDAFCTRPTMLVDALNCLASGTPTIQSAANDLGVSIRTLQRLIKGGTGHSPHFWWSLARVRRAARLLPDFVSLAEAAEAFAYSDQAHMTREMRKWLGVSPKQAQTDSALLALLHETGYH